MNGMHFQMMLTSCLSVPPFLSYFFAIAALPLHYLLHDPRFTLFKCETLGTRKENWKETCDSSW